MSEEMVTITKKEYASLKEDAWWRCCVEAAGVDNWSGMDYAMDEFHKDKDDGVD